MKVVIKILSTVASIASGLLGARLVRLVWQKATGEPVPPVTRPKEQAKQPLGESLALGSLSAVVGTVSAALIKRSTTRAIRRVDARNELKKAAKANRKAAKRAAKKAR